MRLIAIGGLCLSIACPQYCPSAENHQIVFHLLEPELDFAAEMSSSTIWDPKPLSDKELVGLILNKDSNSIVTQKTLTQKRNKSKEKLTYGTLEIPKKQSETTKSVIYAMLSAYSLDPEIKITSIQDSKCEFIITNFMDAETLIQGLVKESKDYKRAIGSMDGKAEWTGISDYEFKVALIVAITYELVNTTDYKYRYRLHTGYLYSSPSIKFAQIAPIRDNIIMKYSADLYKNIVPALLPIKGK
jgi:hypothetical protein